MFRASRLKIGFLAMALLPLMWLAPASGHMASNYYPDRWADQSQPWWYVGYYPDGAYRARVRDGVAEWNSLNRMSWSFQGERASYDPYVCGRVTGTNGVLWRILDGRGNNLGITIRCSTRSAGITTANMVIDAEEDWCTGTGDCDDGFLGIGAKTDLWSVLSHEWGHMTGFNGPSQAGHFDPTSNICEGTPEAAQTMCPFYDGGSERWRTLNTHDEHTYQNAY